MIDRPALLTLLVEEGFLASQIDASLAARNLDPLTEAEKAAFGLSVPDTAADLLATETTAPVEPTPVEKPTVQSGAVLGTNPITGEPFTALNNAVVHVVSIVSSVLRQADLKSWEHYKALKAADPSPAGRIAAYQWAFNRLLELGYVPTA